MFDQVYSASAHCQRSTSQDLKMDVFLSVFMSRLVLYEMFMFIQDLKCSIVILHCLWKMRKRLKWLLQLHYFTVKDNPLWALFRFTLLFFSFYTSLLSFISLVTNKRFTRSHSRLCTLHLVQGFKLMLFFSPACFSNLSAARKSATRYARLSGVFRVHWLKNINSLVSGGADLQYIGITGRGCSQLFACPQSFSFFAFSRSERTHKLHDGVK